jgi:cell fate regulator YaaT (PSP1 superfamily)
LLIEVSFKGNRREFFAWDGAEPPPIRAPVIVEADRGEDLGRVHAVGELALKRSRGTPHGLGDAEPAKHARRLATPDDVRREAELRLQDEEARRRAAERVRANSLAMKLTDAEWQWDRKKLTFYFTADKRVDFRVLVRELAAIFRTRIELKQIGVRDEAKRLDGIGRCGRQYCSASWLPELRPVNLGVAKDQRLSLNPSQISGACGRLMCSLRYEHEFYVQSRRRFPKEGRILRTLRGEEKVTANDIFRERVSLRGPDGETRTIALAELRREAEHAAAELGLPAPTIGHAPAAEAVPRRRGAERDEVLSEQEAQELEGHAPAGGDADVPEGEPGEQGQPPVEVAGAGDSKGRRPRVSAAIEPAEAIASVGESAPDGAPAEQASDALPTPGETRPRRRRGRRGGRRNRPGGPRGPRGPVAEGGQ